MKRSKFCQNCQNLFYNRVWERYECQIRTPGEIYESWSRVLGRPVEKYCDVFNPSEKNKSGNCFDFRWKPFRWLFRRKVQPICGYVWINERGIIY